MNAPNNGSSAPTAALWRANWPLVQLLGLAPLLAATTSLVKGLALGVATLVALVTTSALMALARPLLLPRLRAAAYVATAAIVVTCLDWLTNAGFYALHAQLGVFLPLIVVHAALLNEAGRFATTGEASGAAVLRALLGGIGSLAVLVVFGALRELVGAGTLFGDVALLGGEHALWLRVQLPFDGVLVALLPPGALLGVGLLIALRNRVRARRPEGGKP